MAKAEKLEHINISLPAGLLAFAQRQAEREDRTLSGQIRHFVAEAARLEPPPAPAPFGSELPNVAANAEAIAAARAQIAKLRTRQAQLARLGHNATAATDDEVQRLKFQAEILEQRVEQAERMLLRTANGG